MQPTFRLAADSALILVVEDNLAVQSVMIDCLEPEHVTACASDGESGLERALALRPDLVVCDLQLPGMDGEALVHEMRAHPELLHVPVLMVTGNNDPRLYRLLESDVQDVLTKPFVVAELRGRVRNLLAAKRTLDLLNETVGRHETDLVALATEVARQQGELEEARRAAERANQIKSNFLRMMSHELKTPISAMQLQMRLLERDGALHGSASVMQGLSRIARSSRRLLHLVDTVLEWARVESGRFQLDVEEIDLVELVGQVVGELLPHAQQKHIDLELAMPPELPRLTSDRHVVEVLLIGLVGRAVQLSEHSRVRVEVSWRPSSHSVRVHDELPPLSSEEQSSLFDPLRNVSDLHRVGGSGSGLGLHVVRDIANALDGDVTMERDEHGNTLVLRLPPLAQERTTARIATTSRESAS